MERRATEGRARSAVVDVHAHWYFDDAIAELAQHCPDIELGRTPDGQKAVRWRGAVASAIPQISGDVPDRLGLMDRLGIDVAVLSSGTLDVGWAGAKAGAVARRINDRMAELCRAHPSRFRFLASVPIDDRHALVEELDRAVGLGAVGVAITTTYGGRPLEAPEHRAFWREASAREMVVLVHPCVPPGGPDPLPGSFLLAGFPGETTLAAARLVYAGVLEECPNARVIWSHVGGGLPMLVARLDAGYRRFTTCPRPPSVYLARCYYDTVCAHGAALECARDTFGAGALVFGTDEPHRLDLPEDIMATVRGRPWSSDELTAVLGGTAARLCPPGSLPIG